MSKKVQFDREDYLKANRKLSREEEILIFYLLFNWRFLLQG